MKVLKFTLSGRTAFFKKPDVNSYIYFTYGCVHKVALMGILGAIMGYGGYNQQTQDEDAVYPEFYEKLKDILVGVVPRNPKGHIPKKVQIFNNTVGYANQDGNLIVKEQWLEKPMWDIYLLIQGNIEEEIADRIINNRYKYIPYLGKNDHIANIDRVKLITGLEKTNDFERLDSLFIEDYFQEKEMTNTFNMNLESETSYKYQEILPLGLEETVNKYEFKKFVFTNSKLKRLKESLVFQCDEDYVFFF